MGVLVDSGSVKFSYGVVNDGTIEDPMYSWYTSFGDVSTEWFETIHECKQDLESRYFEWQE